MKVTGERPKRKRSVKAVSKKNLAILHKPIIAAKKLWDDGKPPIFLTTHDADHIAAEERKYFMTLATISADKQVKMQDEPVIQTKQEFEQFFAQENDWKLVNEAPKFTSGWKDMIIRCFFPSKKLVRRVLVSKVMDFFTSVDHHGVISLIAGWLIKCNSKMGVPS